MGNYGLPVTGAAGYAVGDLVLGQGALVLIAVGAIATGVVLVRLSFRRGKSAAEV